MYFKLPRALPVVLAALPFLTQAAEDERGPVAVSPHHGGIAIPIAKHGGLRGSHNLSQIHAQAHEAVE